MMRLVDPATWRLVSPLLDRALDLDDEGRAALLADVRADRPDLAATLEDLLAEHDRLLPSGFLESPLPEREAPAPALAGTTIGAYTLDTPIGVGGMGSVWRARRSDGRFEAVVAVKLLHPAVLDDSAAERFKREGTLLARLSHTNIARLLDAGLTTAGQPYLVLEYVAGVQIDQYADAHRLDVGARLGLFLQVADAVAQAHAHQIVHRDLKPSNILVDDSGQAKLLDFGIAKLLDTDARVSVDLTRTGSRAWTPAYASPEQVRGETVTTSTDIYALGVLLYQLLVNRHPTGAGCTTAAAYLRTIVDVDAVPASVAVTAADVDVPGVAATRATTTEALRRRLQGDLDNILAMALQKAPERRYKSVEAFAEDVRHHLRDEPVIARRDRWIYRARKFARLHRVPVAAAAGVLVTLAVAAVVATRWRTGGPAVTPALSGATRVTSDAGDETWPRFSPDERRIAYAWRRPRALESDIAIKTLGTEGVTTITDGPGNDVMPAWSPDGRAVAFQRGLRYPVRETQVCVAPAAGGPARVLFTVQDVLAEGLAWWEAGNALIFGARRTRDEPLRLVALDLATSRLQPLTSPPPRAPILASLGDHLPIIAPDGRTLAFVRETHDGRYVRLLDLVTRDEWRLTRAPEPITGIAWRQDGQAVIVSSTRASVDALYSVARADGTIAPLPRIADGAKQPAVGRGAGPLAFSQLHSDTNIYRVDLREGQAPRLARPIIASSRLDEAPHISPDGRQIVFESWRGGTPNIWIAAADGTQQRQLTFLTFANRPRWSPDGQLIAFNVVAAGRVRQDIWVVDANGGTPRPLVSDPAFDLALNWSADGRSLYFLSDRSDGFQVWRVPREGGPATRVTAAGGLRAQESGDGAFLYYANDVPEIWRRAQDGRTPDVRVMAFPPDTHWGGVWAVGLRGLYYLNYLNEPATGDVTIDLLPFGPGAARPIRVASFSAMPANGVSFSVAPDESWLALAQFDYRNSDIMMVDRVP